MTTKSHIHVAEVLRSVTKESEARSTSRDGTLTDKAYAAIEEMIVTLKLAPNSFASEAMLAARLKIGRTPVREALQRLSREHLISVLPRSGVVVAPVDVGQQLRMLEVRRYLEAFVVRAAALRATAGERARMSNIVAAIKQSAQKGDAVAFLRLDKEYKKVMLEAARNEYAATALSPMHSLSRRFWFIHNQEADDLENKTKLHIAVMEAVISGDEEAAEHASDELMAYVQEFTRMTLTFFA